MPSTSSSASPAPTATMVRDSVRCERSIFCSDDFRSIDSASMIAPTCDGSSDFAGAAVGRPSVDSRGRLMLRLHPGVDAQAVFAAVMAGGAAVRSLLPVRRSLEDVFLQAVSSATPASDGEPHTGEVQDV